LLVGLVVWLFPCRWECILAKSKQPDAESFKTIARSCLLGSKTVFSLLGISLLLAGYALLVAFVLFERRLRETAEAKTFSRGSFDRGSTVLIAAAFGSGLILPLVLDDLGVGLFRINAAEGLSGVLVMTAGIGLRVWAARTLGSFYTRTLLTTDRQTVTTNGPYARVRHPGYLGDVMLWLGFGILSSNWLLVVLYPVLFVSVYLYRISVEEKMLVGTLGEDYAAYRKRVRKLIPFVY
jgi:protein-S-isoprenylcysteine O-methyltransferase Ste14